MSATKKAILTLIKETQALLSLEGIPPHDYHSLKNAVVQYELQEELKALTALMAEDNYVDLFQARCKARSIWNMNSCLNFCSMSQGVCNELYAKIATLLFEPKTLGDLLQILLPEATCLSGELFLESPKAKRPSLRFEKQALDSLICPPQLDVLENFILVDNILFDVRILTSFDFKFHQTAYELLSQTYRDLTNHLYQHNSPFRTLHNELLMVSGAGQTPLQVIRAFIMELRLSGQTMTGNDDASLSAQVAFTEFKGYLASLPETMKGALEELTLPVVNHLNAGNCVEEAAGKLRMMIENQANQKILNTYPTLSESELLALNKKYGPTHPLPTSGHEALTHLPNQFLKEVLVQISISNAHEWLSMLLSFPPELYAVLLQGVRLPNPPLPQELVGMIKEGILNPEQLKAFKEALVISRDRLGGVTQIIWFFLNTNNISDIIKCLQVLRPTERFAAVAKEDKNGYRIIWHLASYKPELLKSILELCLPADRLAVVKEKNNYGNTVLHLAASYPESLKSILELLPEENRLAVVKEKNRDGNAVLHFVPHRDSESLKSILELYIPADRLAVVKEKNNYGYTVLHFAAYYPESLKSILALLPETERLAALKEKNKDGETVLHVATKNPESLKSILELLPETERLAAVKEKNRDGETVLHVAAKNPESLKSILELLSEENRFTAVKEKNKYGNTVLHRVIYHPESLKNILEVLSEEDRLAALKEKDKDGETVLHLAARSLSSQLPILQLLPKENRRDITKEMSFFIKLSPDELYTLYQKNTANQTLRAIVEERLQELLVEHKKATHSTAWHALVSILAVEGGHASHTQIIPAHLLLEVYFKTTIESHKQLAKTLLIEHGQLTEQKKMPLEDCLALAIIANTENNATEEKNYIHQFTATNQDSSFFRASKTKLSPKEVFEKLIKENPTKRAFIHAYSGQIAKVLHLHSPIQSFVFDRESDENYPL